MLDNLEFIILLNNLGLRCIVRFRALVIYHSSPTASLYDYFSSSSQCQHFWRFQHADYVGGSGGCNPCTYQAMRLLDKVLVQQKSAEVGSNP